MATTAAPVPATPGEANRVASFPRLRYMGSKYRLVPHLAAVFSEIGGQTALDAFSGSGVVSYLLKTLGYQVTASDFLNFPSAIARATVVNQHDKLDTGDVEAICGAPADERDFIQQTFRGMYFTEDDLRFLDSAWSHIDQMRGHKRDLAISSLVLSAARRQPRGVFTFTDLRYNDGRRDLRLSLEEHFRERVQDYNRVVFDSSQPCAALCSDVFDLPASRYDLVYLDPPYAPPKDDNCYIKRYHFLEGLSVYWRGQEIMHDTRTKKLEKRYTPFSYKHSITEALRRTFKQFRESTIVLSYSSNAVPGADTIAALLREVKGDVEVRLIDHTYTFGTHPAAQRRAVSEYLFIGRLVNAALLQSVCSLTEIIRSRPLTCPSAYAASEVPSPRPSRQPAEIVIVCSYPPCGDPGGLMRGDPADSALAGGVTNGRSGALVRRGAPSPAKIVVDSGSAVDLVHYSPPDPPLSPNQP
jgi:adenine-specific DNA-methyltransferase